MLGRQGGRRVYFKGDKPTAFFAGLDEMFKEMRKPPAKLRYELEKFVPGLEILFADENLKAATVWKNGNDLRLLIADKKLREQINADLAKQESEVKYDENTNYEQVNKANLERRMLRAFDDISWRKIVSADSFELTASPPDFVYPPARDGFPVCRRPSNGRRKRRIWKSEPIQPDFTRSAAERSKKSVKDFITARSSRPTVAGQS